MKIIQIILVLICLSAISVFAQTHQVDWYVIGSGGGHSESGNFQIDGTVGQPIVGVTSSENYTIEAGYWVGVGPSGPVCYKYVPGDVNMYNGSWPPQVIGGDVTYLVNYFRGIPSSQPCLMYNPSAIIAPVCLWASADANGDCLIIGSDVTKLVNYFRGMTDLEWCPDFEPCWYTTADVPPTEPIGWPNCVDPCPPELVPEGVIGNNPSGE